MSHQPASIFNDVIGPVMRGPSSSHVAGAWRIADIVRQSTPSGVSRVEVDFDINGSLAESHDGHGTDMGFAAGLLGLEMTDSSVLDAEIIARDKGVEVRFNVMDYGAEHPNNYRITAHGTDGSSHTWEAISVGGGMIEMRRFDGFAVSIAGGFYELLVTVGLDGGSSGDGSYEKILKLLPAADLAAFERAGGCGLVSLKYTDYPGPDVQGVSNMLNECGGCPEILDIVLLKPVLTTGSRASYDVPFSTADELLKYRSDSGDKREFWELAAQYEGSRGGVSEQVVFERMSELLSIMRKGVEDGLKGTVFGDRILGPQSHLIEEGARAGKLVPCDPLNRSIAYITAIMEVKSSMGVIVAAPTAGSCGCLPGTILGVGEALGLSTEQMVKGMLAAGLIGVFFAESATFAAEVAGCQVECGAGSGMAAAGVAQMLGGSVEQCLDAASIALQNITGLACDPVANRVEVPCLGKNIMGGSNAIASANMALAGYDKVIPLDQTIRAIYDIGEKLPLELRCTFGGLGKTRASLDIREKLEKSGG